MNANDAIDVRLSGEIQKGVPFDPDPFARLADAVGTEAASVLARLRAWKADGKLREISAILEGAALGYDSALVAGRVPVGGIDTAAAAVGSHPTVTHSYLRDHAYNLWFTLAVPEGMGLEQTLAILGEEAGGVEFHPLRRTRTFKIGVRFRIDTLENESSGSPTTSVVRFRPDAREKLLLRALQTPLPLVDRPFAALAREGGFEEAELLEFARRHQPGIIRRYSGTFRHRSLGVAANVMVVWNVPEDRLEEAGSFLAGTPEVSHCYARTPLPDFSYNLYSMIHGADAVAVRSVTDRLSVGVKALDRLPLLSVRELKKTRLRYFLPELDEWWSERCNAHTSRPGVA